MRWTSHCRARSRGGRFRVHADVERQDPRGFRFDRALPFVHGYGLAEQPSFARAAAVWRVPVMNPAWSVGTLLQVDRLSVAPFWDVGLGIDDPEVPRTRYATAGTELTAGPGFGRIAAPLETRVRLAWSPGTDRLAVQPVAMGTLSS